MTAAPVRALPLAAAAGLAVWLGAGSPSQAVDAQQTVAPDPRFAGLSWTFARVRYEAWTMPRGRFTSPEDEPWYIDAPAAEQNLSRRLKTVTSITVNDPVVVTIEDPNLWNYPWLYLVEPGNLRLRDAEVPILREFLLRGGTLTFDDFHGPIEWDNMEQEMRRVFPDRKIVELPLSHPVYSCFYQLDGFPQTPGLGLVSLRTHVGEGRLRRQAARDRRRPRPRDGADQLEHRHGRRLGVVQRRRVSGLRASTPRRRTGCRSTRSSTR